MNPLPTSVEITTHPEQGRDILRINGRTMGCKIKDRLSVEEAELILKRWWETELDRQWQWGDFILQCEQRWGDEQTSQIIPDHDIAAQTIANWSSVAKQYAHTERLYNLRWSHYAEVAYVWNRPLRAELLLWAEKGNKSVIELREQKKKRLEELAKAAKTTQDGQGDDLNIPPVQTAVEINQDQISQIMMGNVRGLFAIVKSWRGVIQPGKKYRIVLEEVR